MILDFFNGKPVTKESVEKQYRKELESINVHWSVISNLRSYRCEEARDLELLCIQNIAHYAQLQRLTPKPMKYAPCYIRLCMLYEKQGRYDDAVIMCKQAIDVGAYDDRTPGKMQGRLARLLRKASEQIPDEEVI